MYAMWNGKENERFLIKNAIEEGKAKYFDEIIQAVKTSGGIQYTLKQAKKQMLEAQKCLNELPESIYRNDLEFLLKFALSRKH